MRKDMLIGIMILGILLFGCVAKPPDLPKTTSGCLTKECFLAAANACKNESLRLNESFGTVLLSTRNCTFIKTVLYMNYEESTQIKDLVEGTSMTCIYKKGEFDQDWMNSLILGVEKCDGTLKDAIADLLALA